MVLEAREVVLEPEPDLLPDDDASVSEGFDSELVTELALSSELVLVADVRDDADVLPDADVVSSALSCRLTSSCSPANGHLHDAETVVQRKKSANSVPKRPAAFIVEAV